MIKYGIEPNFFISEPYLNQPNLIGRYEKGWVWVEEDGLALFPPLPLVKGFFNSSGFPEIPYFWSDFNNLYGGPGEWFSDFLDWEYLYDPKNFKDLSGGKWQTFRKNSRKWLKMQGGVYSYQSNCPVHIRAGLLGEWLEDREQTIQDAEFIAECVLNSHKDLRLKYLFDKEGELAGINIWDENWMYINYRFCIVRKDPFLDEFMRLNFYLDPIIQKKNKLVNDGGSLENIGLERFKDRLNPVRKRIVSIWTKNQ